MAARFVLTLIILLCAGTTAWTQTVHVDENFDNYADDAALWAKWAPVGTNEGALWTSPLGNLNPNANPTGGNGLDHIGGPVNIWNTSFGTLKPTSSLNIVLEGDIYDRGNTGSKRMSIGLRQNSGINNLFEMGLWNTVGGNYYAFRMVTFGATLPSPDGTTGWQRFTDVVDDAGVPYPTGTSGNSNKGEGWHHYKAVFMETQAVITLDLFRDGNVNSTMVIPYTFTTTGFEQLRVGGPSGATSVDNLGAGSVVFDNIKLYTETAAVPTDNADFNGDNVVDGADFLIWQQGFGTGATLAAGDANNDLAVDGLDLEVWKTQFGTDPTPAVGAIGAVPEPTTLALAGLAMAAAGLAARRR